MEGPAAMRLREAAYSVRREEFGRIEYAFEYASHLRGIDEALYIGRLAAALHGITAETRELRAVVEEPAQVLLERWEGREPVFLQSFHGEQRNQPHQRAHAELGVAAVALAQHVVKETVLFVPQLVIAVAHVLHGGADVDEVLEELGGEALVTLVLKRELERDAHHVQRIHRHPPGGVALLEHGAARQRLAAVEHGDVVEAENAHSLACSFLFGCLLFTISMRHRNTNTFACASSASGSAMKARSHAANQG